MVKRTIIVMVGLSNDRPIIAFKEFEQGAQSVGLNGAHVIPLDAPADSSEPFDDHETARYLREYAASVIDKEREELRKLAVAMERKPVVPPARPSEPRPRK